jgi:hypothetical protein
MSFELHVYIADRRAELKVGSTSPAAAPLATTRVVTPLCA